MNCLSFLVNFGANIWALDNDAQSALDVAAMRGATHDEIVRYLDSEMGRQTRLNPKEVQRKKLKALADAEKRLKRWQKLTRNGDSESANQRPRFGAVSQSGASARSPSGKSLNQKLKETLRFGRGHDPKPVCSFDVVPSGAPVGRTYSDYVLNGKKSASQAHNHGRY